MNETTITVTIISAVVSVITVFLSFMLKSTFESYFHVFKLDKDHEYEQRKKIKEVISRNKTRIIDSADSLNHRMLNLNKNYKKNWHIYDKEHFPENQYYLTSFIYRILVFYYWCRTTEKDMIYLDSTVATEQDLYFVKFLKLMPQILCDGVLFKGLDYDYNYSTDNFFKNDFMMMVEQMQGDKHLLTFNEFKKKINEDNIDISKMIEFLSGISPEEKRLRWYRLQAMHYVLLMFINTYGYDFQYTELSEIRNLKNMHRPNPTIKNLKHMLIKFKLLKNSEVSNIFNELKS